MLLVQYPKRYCKSSRYGPLKAEQPKRDQTAFLTPKRYDEHPRLIRESAPPPLGILSQRIVAVQGIVSFPELVHTFDMCIDFIY